MTKLLRMDNCPQCDEPMSPVHHDKIHILHCEKCEYSQLAETRERLDHITDALCDELFAKGIDKVLIKDQELDINIALRADAVLPLIVDHYMNQAGTDNDMAYKAVPDEKSFLKYRVIYVGGSLFIKKDVHKMLCVLLDLYTETRERMPEHDRYIDMNILLDEEVAMKHLSNDKSGDISEDKHSTKNEDDILKTEKHPVVLSMVEERNEASQLGLFKALKNEGVDLVQIDSVSTISEILNKEFPWFTKVTEIIFSQLAVREQGDNIFHITPILLLGDPGVGKTAYCSRLAELSQVPYHILGLAGSMSNQVLAGTERGWSSAKSSLAVQTILDHKIGNPLIVLDELDKAGGSESNGHPVQTLLGLLEPSSAKNWFDPFLMGHVDLSFVNWIATANDIKQLPTTFLSRIRVINVEGPAKDDYPAIINRTRHVFAKENGIDIRLIPQFGDVEWNWIEQYCKTPRMARKATEVLVRNMVLGGPGQRVH